LARLDRFSVGAYVLSLMRNVGWVVLGWLCSLGCTSLNSDADERLFGSVEPTLAHGSAGGSPTMQPPAAGAAGAAGAVGAAGAPSGGCTAASGCAGGQPCSGDACDPKNVPPECSSPQKLCGGVCVAGDATNGCDDTSCTPCAPVEHGASLCRGDRCDFDCEPGFVRMGDGCAPPPATCSDSIRNGTESDVDCGGDQCPPCATGKRCGNAGDCATSVCTDGVCDAPSCTDRVQNGEETATDCGGPTCDKCGPGKTCKRPTDCSSGVCANGLCRMASCFDKVMNGAETDTDCGGNCMKCAPGRACSDAGDCSSGVCSGGVCHEPSCDDGVKNGTETGPDCGGSCAPCSTGGLCLVNADCQSGACVGRMCRVACPTSGSADGCPPCLLSAYTPCCRADDYCGCSSLGRTCTF